MLTSDALDAIAHEYYLNQTDDTIDQFERAQLHSVPRLVDAIGDRSPVLELGFGTGHITAELLRLGVPLEVVEGSPALVDEARRRHPDLTVHHAMFEHFDAPSAYGAILALHVLEHVADPVELLVEMRSWLADDGTLVAVVPNAESLHRRIAVEMGLHERLDDLGPSDHLIGHQRVYDLDGLTRDLDLAGFDVTADFGYLLKTVPNSMMLDYPMEMIEALNTISDRIPTRDLANIGVRAVPRRRRRTPAAVGRAPALITSLILSDGDAAAAERSVASLRGLVDEAIVVERSEVDWTDTVATRALIDGLVDEWVMVLAAGEQLRVTDPDAFHSMLRDETDDDIVCHVGLGAEVRIHRRGPAAMLVIGSEGGEPSRVAAIAPDEPGGEVPAVSVIVPTFNRHHLLRRCLEALAVQTTTDLEVIVVNDGGLDVGSVVAAFEDTLDITLITRPHNGGAAAAMNTGLAAARGRYAHFQADDDTIPPHHVRLLATALDHASTPDTPVGLVYGPALMLEEDENGTITDSQVVFRGSREPDELMWRNFIVGGTAMFDRQLAVSIGGMNTDFEVLEDWEFWLRLAHAADVHYVDIPTAEYRMRSGTSNVTPRARPRFYKSLLQLYEAHPCEPDSVVATEREKAIAAQADSHGDDYAWEHTVAVIGTGDLPALAGTLGSVMDSVDQSSLQLIVHDLRTDDAELLLRDLARDATVCLHAFIDEERCRSRIDRQAGGRTLTVLRAGERFTGLSGD